jgi:hypothetical protein
MRKLQPLQLDGSRVQSSRNRRHLSPGFLDFPLRTVYPEASDFRIVALDRTLREENLFPITDFIQREFQRRGAAVQA